jgi:hypothetical protein
MLSIPVRLASRARLLAADVAAAFAPIVALINGNLAAENYAPGAIIANAAKQSANAIVPVQIFTALTPQGATTTYRFRVMPSVAPLHAIRWTATRTHLQAGGPNFSATIKLFRDAVQKGTTQAIVDPASGAIFIDEVLDVAPTDADSEWSVEVVVSTAGDSIPSLVFAVWFKAPHVR